LFRRGFYVRYGGGDAVKCQKCGAEIPENANACPGCQQPNPAISTGGSTLGVQKVFDELWGDRFQIRRMIGRGAMGAVFKAYDTKLDRDVAIKLIRKEFVSSPEPDSVVKQRFEAEIRAAGRLLHPNIVSLFDASASGDTFYIVMEFIDGVSLKDMMRSHGRLPPERALFLIRGICQGLDYAHRQGIIHRDIKPANIMVSVDDEVKIADFGIAKFTTLEHSTLTAPGQVVGTPHYMAPERFRSEPYDGRADLFAVGCILYEILTGHHAFGGDSLPTIVFKIMNQMPPSPSTLRPQLSPAWDELLMKALAKEADDRYQTGEDLVEALEAVALTELEQETTDGGRSRTAAGLSAATGTGRLPDSGARTVISASNVFSTVSTLFGMSFSWTVSATKRFQRRMRRAMPVMALTAGLAVLLAGSASRIPPGSTLSALRPQQILPGLFSVSAPNEPPSAVLRHADEALANEDAAAAATALQLLADTGTASLTTRLLHAQIQAKKGDAQALATAEALAGEFPSEPAAIALYADQLARAEQWQPCYDLLAPVAEQNPANSGVKYRLAVAAFQLGRLDQARSLLTDCIAAAPDAGWLYNNLGVIYFSLGEYPRALDSFTRASWIRGESSDVHRNLALMHRIQRQPRQEVEALTRWKDFGGADPELDERLAQLTERLASQSTGS